MPRVLLLGPVLGGVLAPTVTSGAARAALPLNAALALARLGAGALCSVLVAGLGGRTLCRGGGIVAGGFSAAVGAVGGAVA